jgi:hypothetical protein
MTDPCHDWRKSLLYAIAFSSRDWSINRNDAWIYGIVAGWDRESIDELKQLHHWTDDAVARLTELREQYTKEQEAMRPLTQENNND